MIRGFLIYYTMYTPCDMSLLNLNLVKRSKPNLSMVENNVFRRLNLMYNSSVASAYTATLYNKRGREIPLRINNKDIL